jgi:hypothetical protein
MVLEGLSGFSAEGAKPNVELIGEGLGRRSYQPSGAYQSGKFLFRPVYPHRLRTSMREAYNLCRFVSRELLGDIGAKSREGEKTCMMRNFQEDAPLKVLHGKSKFP